VHETVSGAQAGALSELATLGKTLGAATIIHRTVRCASHAPSQRSVARSAGDTWTSPTVTRAHRTVRCATGSVAATVGFAEKEGNQALFTVRRASHAPSQRSRATSGDAWTSPTVTRAHQTVRCATGLVAAMISFARKGRKSGTIHCPVVHRTVRCGSHAPSQRSIARSAGDTWTSPTVTRGTGLSGVPRGWWLQRSASPEKEGNQALFTVRWCTGLSGVPAMRPANGRSRD
jgi:hypothetical protein